MQCTIHGNKEATGTCAYCGRPYCQECLVNINGMFYCKEHVAEVINGQQPGTYHNQPAPTPQAPYPNPTYVNNHYHPPYPPYPYYHYKSRVVALLLCIFLGIGGFHRFYAGKIGTGLLWLFTGGFFGIGWIVDIILIASGAFTDSNGYKLV